MAWIRIPGDGSPSEAGGEPQSHAELEGLRRRSVDPTTGEVDEILAVHSLHPAGWDAHLRLYHAVMRGTPGLRKVDREMIALVVSRENGCHY